MPENYFDKFQKIYYNDKAAIDITQRAVILNKNLTNQYLFYPYDLSSEIRADQLADSYYQDQYMSWLIYFSNGIVDPYYDWYLSESDFTEYLKKKYRIDPYVLQSKVAFYRTNWPAGTSGGITVEQYQNLDYIYHRYWEPEYGEYGEIFGYKRRKEDVTVSTNYVVKYALNGTTFKNNEIVHINFDSEHLGRGQVASSNSTFLTLQHLSGSFLANSTVTIGVDSRLYGDESQSNVVFTSSVSVANNIPLEEGAYWAPVSIYDYEVELNSKKKNIKLLDRNFSTAAAKELKRLLK